MILKLCVCFGVWIPNQNKQVDKYQVALSFLKVPDPKLAGLGIDLVSDLPNNVALGLLPHFSKLHM